MKNRLYTLITILVILLLLIGCGVSKDLQEGENLQETVVAQNTQIAQLSSNSAPTLQQQSSTERGSTNETSPTVPNIQTSGDTLFGSFPLINGLIGYPIKHTVGDENSYSDGFRKVFLELFIQNTSSSLANATMVGARVFANLIDSNQFTQPCSLDNIHKMVGSYFPPNFGVPYELSCNMPNNASVESFTITIDGEEMISFPATPDGIYNEKPSFEDMLGDQFASGGVATVDNIAKIELVSARLEPEPDSLYANDVWIISLKIKNLYGASIRFASMIGIVRDLVIISDQGMFARTFAGEGYSYFAEGSLPEIPPGGEATWDFASLAEASPNSALLILIGRANNDPAYNGELLYTLLRLPPP